jgi:ferredoxin
MPVVKADLGQCQGYGNCVAGADDTFDLDDDGVVVLLRTEIPESDRNRIEAAAQSCPVSALTVAGE